jgi:hypothetical protein
VERRALIGGSQDTGCSSLKERNSLDEVGSKAYSADQRRERHIYMGASNRHSTVMQRPVIVGRRFHEEVCVEPNSQQTEQGQTGTSYLSLRDVGDVAGYGAVKIKLREPCFRKISPAILAQ